MRKKSLTNNQDNKEHVRRHRTYLGLNECATVDILRGKINPSKENVQLSDSEELQIPPEIRQYDAAGGTSPQRSKQRILETNTCDMDK